MTEIIQAAQLGPNYSAVPPAILERARLRGAGLHAAIQYDIEGTLDPESLHPEIAPGFAAYRRFRDEAHVEPLLVEVELRHRSWQYVGHADLVAWVGDKRTLLDWKYQESVDLDAGTLQLAGYRLAYSALYPLDALQTALVQVKRDGTYRLHVVDAEAATHEFIACLIVYRARQRRNHA